VSDRDSWSTPSDLTALLPAVDLDPCSNSRSTVRAARTYDLARGEDGLVLPWAGVTFVNGPFSNLGPWAAKLLASPDVTAAAFLVNVDTSTVWWSLLRSRLPVALMFHKRIQFTAPEGVKSSTNNKPQALLMDGPFLARCSPDLLALGDVWWLARPTARPPRTGVSP
jgi:hypothetical protein